MAYICPVCFPTFHSLFSVLTVSTVPTLDLSLVEAAAILTARSDPPFSGITHLLILRIHLDITSLGTRPLTSEAGSDIPSWHLLLATMILLRALWPVFVLLGLLFHQLCGMGSVLASGTTVPHTMMDLFLSEGRLHSASNANDP